MTRSPEPPTRLLAALALAGIAYLGILAFSQRVMDTADELDEPWGDQ